jgi:uncharacterized repeat protein (TIGR03803 family)
MKPRTKFQSSMNDSRHGAVEAILTTGLILLPLMAAGGRAQTDAPTFSVFYTFTGGVDGAQPQAGLVLDSAGNLYGTTAGGGTSTECSVGAFTGCGTVFKVSPSGAEAVLYSFTGGTDGAFPTAGLVLDGHGNLYGTTPYGGAYGPDCYASCGVVFSVDPAGEQRVLHTFKGATLGDGANPEAGLFRDAAGDLYGTTSAGGVNTCLYVYGCGTVFEVSRGTETVLYSFGATSTDGTDPEAGLIRDAAGNLYGTTEKGGAGEGIVFKLSPSGPETILQGFGNDSGPQAPVSGLVEDSAGNLYGTTLGGGSHGGYGTVYKVDSSDHEQLLFSFNGKSDGGFPSSTLIRDAQGNLYGTASGGGSTACFDGCGLVFKLDPQGNETVLYSFTGGSDGASPYAGLVLDRAGNLYGTTPNGGAYGAGVVYKIALR